MLVSELIDGSCRLNGLGYSGLRLNIGININYNLCSFVYVARLWDCESAPFHYMLPSYIQLQIYKLNSTMNYRREVQFGGNLNHSNVSRQQPPPPGGFTPTRSRARTNFDFGDMGTHNLGELENILERERVKFKDIRDKLEA